MMLSSVEVRVGVNSCRIWDAVEVRVACSGTVVSCGIIFTLADIVSPRRAGLVGGEVIVTRWVAQGPGISDPASLEDVFFEAARGLDAQGSGYRRRDVVRQRELHQTAF